MKKRADGRYQVRVFLGIVDGKKTYKSVFGKTQKEVNKKAEELKIKLNKGINIITDNDSFGQWVERWMIYKKDLLSENQHDFYKRKLKYFAELNDKKLNKIEITDLQAIINRLAKRNPITGKPTARKTLRDIRMTANQVFEFAIMNRATNYNPAKYLEIPRNSPKQVRRALTQEEQQWIINTPHRAQLPAMIMMMSGLRLGECLALQWRDIDLINSTIDVHQVLKTVNGKLTIEQGAKTANSIRIVDIPDLLVTFLKKQPKHSPFDYVVTNTNGNLMSKTNWQHLWNSYKTDLNFKYGDFSMYLNKPKSKFQPQGVPFVIQDFTAHYLRHTHATNLFKAGYDVLYIQEQLGHSSPSVTLDIYTHLVKDKEKKGDSKLDKYLKNMPA